MPIKWSIADVFFSALCLFILVSPGCASPCLLIDGSCLELTINSSLASGSLQLTLFSGSAGQQVSLFTASLPGEEVDFPALLRVLPPPGHSASEISALSVSALAGGNLVQTGALPLTWPSGAHLTRELSLAPLQRPARPVPMPPWQYSLVTQDFSAVPLGVLTSTRLAGDDKDALIATHPGISQLATLQSSGDGRFHEVATSPVQAVPSALLAADLTSDGHPEVIAVSKASGKVQLFLGLPGGRLESPQELLQRADFDLQSPTLTDVNDDGLPDLLLINRSRTSNSFIVQLLGRNIASSPLGNAAFLPSGSMSPIALTKAVYGLAGNPKQLAIIHADSEKAVALWDSLKPIEAAPTADFYPVAVTAGDLDNDGQPDLAVAYGRGMQNGRLRILRGQGSGAFTLLRELELPAAPRGLWAADLARDGAADLVVACDSTPAKLYVLPGTTGSNSALFSIDLGDPVGDPVLLDLNGDQWLDVVVQVQNPSRIISLIGQPM